MTSVAGYGLQQQGTATVAIGTVATVPYEQGCSVTDSGSPTSAILDFSLARGQQGAQGETGPAGDTGPKGDQGDPGLAATVTAGTATSTAYGNPPQVTNSGTSSAAVFDFVIPAGQQGPQGNPGTVTDPLPLNELQVRQIQGFPTDNPSSLLINGDSVAGQGSVTVNASHADGITISAPNGPITLQAQQGITTTNPMSLYSLQTRGVRAYPTDNPPNLQINGDSITNQGSVTVNASHTNGISLVAPNGKIDLNAGAGGLILNTGTGGLTCNAINLTPQRVSGTMTFTGTCWTEASVFVGYEYMVLGNLNILWIQPVMGLPGGASGIPSASWPTGIVPLPPLAFDGTYRTPCNVIDVVDDSVFPIVVSNFAGQCTVSLKDGVSTISFSSSCNGTNPDHAMSTFNQPGYSSISYYIGAYATQIVWFST